ncbi:dTDP-4-dehydrorhamnose reductase [Paenibacillus koleovorans]|uniref:dTDP-4-dehydrorhamnose reductase n=1 Tax=Paenibacillus koleovorans TaxID=121608 RepID=UPI000FD90318|nr:dTDP-4-dehydrorhamnose reductase [Paenibacillus koleovorans]
MTEWKRIVLLGASGQLGTDLRRVLGADGALELVPVVRTQLDVSDIGRIVPFLQSLLPFDVLINCTSYHKTDECEDQAEKAFAINALAPREMARFCADAGVRLVHFTTDYVFAGDTGQACGEDDPTWPLNVYGVSKSAGEQLIRAYAGERYWIIRVSSLFGEAGASGKGGNFVETMIRLARAGGPITVVDDQIMSPTHTLDIAKAVRAMLRREEEPPCGIYHCSGEGACSWYSFAREIFAQLQLDVRLSPVSSGSYATKAKRPAYSVLQPGKLRSFYPMPRWQDALAEYLQIKHPR